MQKLLNFLLIAFILICCNSLVYGQKEIFLKQVTWKLEYLSENSYENEYFMTMKFNKGESYRFKITNHMDNFAGEAVIEVLDADKLVLTNNVGDKYYDVVNLVCNKTGFYDVLIRFKDNKLGNSIIHIFLLQ